MAAAPECTVLVIDDSEEMLRFIEVCLSGDNYRVLLARRIPEALGQIERQRPDLLLIDLQLVGESGETLFREAQTRWPSLPCVFLTGHSSVEKAVELMRAGALDYITKPVMPDVLTARIGLLRDRVLQGREIAALRSLIEPHALGDGLIVGTDPGMLKLLQNLVRVARTDAPVLITGESGTGKEQIASAIHRASRRAKDPFVPVNVAAVPASLFEREFFGHLRGAFTDARADSPGLVARAEHGTLFMDEIGELPITLQASLLRFLQEREYRPIGATREVQADVRVVCATNRDLRKLVAAGTFREDLLYRLDVVPLHVPALRDRPGDIPLLAHHFLTRYAKEFGVEVQGFSPSANEKLMKYRWPGNVRELENVVQRLVATASRTIVVADDVPLVVDGFVGGADMRAAQAASAASDAQRNNPDAPLEPLVEARRRALDHFERDYLDRALRLAEGNITQAAALADMPRKTFWRLLKRHGIEAVRDGVVSKPGRPRVGEN